MDQTTTNAIRAKIAKLLRMQQSPNANEAANAAEMVERLCREHGLSAESINADYDPDTDEVVLAEINTGKRALNNDDVVLMNAVVNYYNGYFVTAWSDANGLRTWEIFASKANHIQIGLYYDYLKEKREQALKLARRPEWQNARSFNSQFRRVYGVEIRTRLRVMALERDGKARQITAGPGLVAISRPAMERQMSEAAAKTAMPGLKTRTIKTNASREAHAQGQAAGRSVGLNKQATGGSARALGAGQ